MFLFAIFDKDHTVPQQNPLLQLLLILLVLLSFRWSRTQSWQTNWTFFVLFSVWTQQPYWV